MTKRVAFYQVKEKLNSYKRPLQFDTKRSAESWIKYQIITGRANKSDYSLTAFYDDGSHKLLKNPSRFKKLERKLAKEHGGSPSSYGGLAAYIGRKKYGAKKFEAMAKAGRKKARKNPRETATIPVRGIKIAKNGEIQILANQSSKRKLSNLAKRLGGKLY